MRIRLFMTFVFVTFVTACSGGGHHHDGGSSSGSSGGGTGDGSTPTTPTDNTGTYQQFYNSATGQYTDSMLSLGSNLYLNPTSGQVTQIIPLGGNQYLDPTTGQILFQFEKITEVSKDLEKVGAVMDKAQTRKVGEQLAANYGLSEDRGIEVAGLMKSYQDLRQTRALTSVDQDRFAQAILGSNAQDLQNAANAYSAGKTDNIEALVERAAVKNGTTPENVRQILGQLMQ